MKKRWLLALLLLTAGLISWQFWPIRSLCYQINFELFQENDTVDEIDELTEILDGFETIPFEALSIDFKKETGSNSLPFANSLKQYEYYLVPADQLYRRLVGNIRLKQFVSRDDSYRRLIMGHRSQLPVLLDVSVLQKLIELRQELRLLGYDPDAFCVKEGHRNPIHNAAVGGASRSRHIYGEAVDILVKDINSDGRKDDLDKEIVLQLLESQIIGDEGGIGRYPGTMIVHLDVRGYRARWDSY